MAKTKAKVKKKKQKSKLTPRERAMRFGDIGLKDMTIIHSPEEEDKAV